jgi:hypothetical protein
MIIDKNSLNRLQYDMRLGVAMSCRKISLQFVENGLLNRLTRDLNSNSDEPFKHFRVLRGKWQIEIV